MGIKYRFNRLRKAFAFYRINHFYSGTSHFEKKRKILNKIGFSIGEGSKIVGPLKCTGRLVVGNNSWIGADLKIYGNGDVIIGSNCDLGPNVTFLTGGHSIGESDRRAGSGEKYTQKVGDGSWICGNVTIIKSVEIGKGSIVAASSLVNKNIGDSVLAGGIPCKEIRKL